MLNVLALVPDYVEKPSGGLGEQFRNVRETLQHKVNYYICGYPEKNNIVNYKSVVNPFSDFKHAALSTIFGQSLYLQKALEYNVNFDVIHAFDWSTFVAGVLCSWHFKKPLVCTVQLSLFQLNKSGIFYCHDPSTVDGKHINELQIYFEAFGLEYANRVIHVSDYYANQYPQFKDKSITLYNGLKLNEWVPKKIPNLPGKNKFKFCYIGRASAMKGIDTILNANIPEDIDFYFVVSSKNAEEPYFSNIKNKCNGKNIFHIPGLYGQHKIDFLFAMDGVVMPSMHEPFGIVALEALISNNFLITTASGGIQEIVKDIEYFHMQTPQDLINAFVICSNLAEEDVLRIKEKGRNRAHEFNWNNIANDLCNVYESVKTEKYHRSKTTVYDL